MLQTGDLSEEVVSGRAIDLPIAGEELIAGENLFDHEVRRPLRRRSRLLERGQGGVERLTIAGRVRKPVDVIDPKSVDKAARVELERQGVHGLEYVVPFDSQACELVDVEEAAPIDSVAGALPPGEHVILPLKQRME